MIIIIHIISKLPLGLRIFLGRFFGSLYGMFPSRERKIAELQMSICLKDKYKPEMLRGVFANVGQTTMESLNLDPILKDIDTIVDTENWDLSKTVSSERPTIVLTGHTSNWDLLAAYSIKKGFPLYTIGKRARNPKAQLLLEKLRGAYGVKTIWREDSDSLKQILTCFKNKEILAALIDQDTNVKSAHYPFFSLPAKYPVSLISMAIKSNARIVAAFIFRTSVKRYKVTLHDLDHLKDADAVLNEYSRILENHIREYPEQWVWFHKRWRTLEDGRCLSTRDYIKYLENHEYEKTANAA